MPKKAKQLNEQSRRFMEFAEEVGACATEEEFERRFRRAVPAKTGHSQAARKRTLPRKPNPS